MWEMKLALSIVLLFCINFSFSQDLELINNEGLDLLEAGKYEEALSLFNKAVELDSSTSLFRYNRAVALTYLERYKEAVIDYLMVIKELPDEPEYHFQIANAYEKLNQVQLALESYSRAISLEKSEYLYFLKRGTLLLKINKFNDAIPDFNETIKINPYNSNAFHNRGISLFKIGQFQNACEDWCKAKQLGNGYSESHLNSNCAKIKTLCSK